MALIAASSAARDDPALAELRRCLSVAARQIQAEVSADGVTVAVVLGGLPLHASSNAYSHGLAVGHAPSDRGREPAEGGSVQASDASPDHRPAPRASAMALQVRERPIRNLVSVPIAIGSTTIGTVTLHHGSDDALAEADRAAVRRSIRRSQLLVSNAWLVAAAEANARAWASSIRSRTS